VAGETENEFRVLLESSVGSDGRLTFFNLFHFRPEDSNVS